MLMQLSTLCKHSKIRVLIDYETQKEIGTNKPACLAHKISLTSSNNKQILAPLILFRLQIYSIPSVKHYI